jgi:hypothetical protein
MYGRQSEFAVKRISSWLVQAQKIRKEKMEIINCFIYESLEIVVFVGLSLFIFNYDVINF